MKQESRKTKRHSVVIAGLAGAGLIGGVAMTGGIIGAPPVIAYATGNVAAIGTDSYGTLQEAITAAQNGDTIQMLASTNLTETITINKSLTIDLNGKSIEATDCRAFWVKNGTVTLSGTGTISATGGGLDESSSVIRVGDATTNEAPASVVIGEGVTVSSNRCYGVTVFGKNVDSGSGDEPISLVVNGKVLVTASGEADAAISGNGNAGLSRTSVVINDGAVVSATNQTGIYHPGAGSLTINGGKVTGPTAVYIKSGTLNVTGGTLEGTGDAQGYAYYGNGPKATGDALVVDSCGYPNGAPAVSISGGTFVSVDGAGIGDYTYGEAPQAEVTANTTNITLPDGFVWTASEGNTYIATKAESLVSVTHEEVSTNYATLSEAMDAVQDGDTLTLLHDINIPSISYNGEASFTLDLNGKSLGKWVSFWNGTVTIQNGTINGRLNAYDSSTVTLGATADVHGQVVVWGDGTFGQEGCKTPTLNIHGKVTNTGDSAITTNGTDKSSANINVYDGAKIISTDDIAIYQPSGNVTVSGGTITGATAIYQKSGTLSITGGTLHGTGTKTAMLHDGNGANATGDAIVIESCAYPNGTPSMTVSGSTSIVSDNAAGIGDYVYDEAPQASVVSSSNNIPLSDGLVWISSSDGNGYEVASVTVTLTHNESTIGYATLEEALAAAQDGDVVCLVDDISTNRISYDGSASFVLDLGGKTLSERLTFNDGTVTIRNGTISGRLDAYDGSVVTIASDAEVSGQVVVWGDGIFGQAGCKTPTLHVHGTVINTGDSAITTNGSDKSGAEIFVHDGATVTSTDEIAIYQPSGNVTISGGTITGTTAIYQKSGALAITGGTITGLGEKAPMVHDGNGASATGDAIVVESCDYPNSVPQTSISGNPTVSSTNAAGIGDYVYGDAPLAEIVANSNSIPLSDGLVWVASADGNSYEVAQVTVNLTHNETTTGYATLAAALSDAQDGDVVCLLDDVSINRVSYDGSASFTLDLGGKTLSQRVTFNNGTVTIQNGTISGRLDVYDTSVVTLAADANVSGQVVVWGDGTFGQDGCKTPTLNVYGTVVNTGDSAITTNGTDESGANINICEGATVTSTDDIAIYQPSGNVTVSGGTITGATAIYQKSGNLTITGGTITGNGAKAPMVHDGNGASATGDAIVVESCDYPNSVPATNISGNPTVSSTNAAGIGDYVYGDAPLAEIVASSNSIPLSDGLVWVASADGNSYEVARTVISLVSDGAETGYTNLADAIQAAQDGDVIKLLDDISLSATQEITKNISIDLNGHDIEATNARALWVKNGEVSIVDTSDGQEKGTIVATGENLDDSSSVIRIGDKNSNGAKAKLTVDEGITIASDRCYGVTVFGVNDTDGDKATSDIEAIINGNVNVTGTASAISGNGTSTLSATTVTIGSDAHVTATQDYAIYHPGKGTLTVNGYVEGTGGIEAKGGTIVINDGATVKATASEQSHTAYNNGASTSGYAIAAVNNPNYAGDPTVTINGGTVDGKAVILADYSAENTGTVTATSNQIPTDPDCKWVEGDTPGTYKLVPRVCVARIGDEAYEDFASAVAAAQQNDTIKLFADVSLDATQVIGESITIDLNGHDIEATNARALWVKNGEVSIVDTSDGQEKGTISATGANLKDTSSVIRVGDTDANGTKAKLTVGEGVTIASDRCYGVTVFGVNDTDSDKTTADIEAIINGNINVTGTASALSGNGTSTLSATTITIGSDAHVTATQDYAIYHPGKGTLTVNGYIEGTGGIEAKGGTIVINSGATVKATASEQTHTAYDNGASTSGYAIAAVNNPNYAGDPTVTINGGTITGKAIILADYDAENTCLVTATSNEISIDPEYKWVESSTPGTYELALRTYVAQIGDDTYEDLSDAIAAAQSGDTIKLLDDIHLDAVHVITKNLTFDLNGHDIETTNARTFWVPSGEVSIVDNSTGDKKGTVSSNFAAPSEFSDSSSVIRVGDGSANDQKAKLTVGEGVTIASNHCYGVTVFGVNDTDSDKTTADIEAIINGNINVTGTASALSGNGTNTLSATTITVGSNANITATQDYAIYHPGKGTLTVNGYVEGTGGIEAKGGTVNINDGATVKATASEQSHTAYNNGASTSGYAIAAVNNPNYAGDPTVTINGGTIDGKAVILADYSAENTGTVTATSNQIPTDPDYKWIEGDTAGTYKLVPKPTITSVEVTGTLTYNGAAQTPTVVVKAGDETLGTSDYTLSYTSESESSAVQDAKEYVVTATAKATSDFVGSATATFQVAPKSIADNDVEIVGFDEWVELVTAGQPVTQNISLTFGNITLDSETDYTIEYASNTQTGTATMTVTGKGNYCGTLTRQFAIQSLDLANATITLSQDTYTYDGTAHEPTATVKMTVDGEEVTLTKDTDYQLTYSGNQNAGEATAIVTGLSPYSGATSATFTIEKASVDVPVATADLTYDATPQTGVPASTDDLYGLAGDVTGTNAGDYVATATLNDSANYKWSDDTSESKEIPWSIAQAPLTIAADNQSKAQGATDPQLTATVTGLKGTDTIQYDLIRDEGNDVGTYDINVVCEKEQYPNYDITLTKGTFTITAVPVNNVKFRDVNEFTSHHKDIDWLAANGISTGWPIKDDPNWVGWSDFRPGNEVIRADMAAFLFRLGKLSGIVDDDWTPQPATKAKFRDVNESTSHAKEIWWLAETEISAGWREKDGSYTFRPFNSVVRQDMAAFLYRLAIKEGKANPSWTPQPATKAKFRDVNESTSHAKEIWWLADSEVSTGWDEHDGTYTFRGMNPIIRQDMAAFLHRLANLPKLSE